MPHLEMKIMAHCECNSCKKRFMQYKDQLTTCPHCGSNDWTIKEEAAKGVWVE